VGETLKSASIQARRGDGSAGETGEASMLEAGRPKGTTFSDPSDTKPHRTGYLRRRPIDFDADAVCLELPYANVQDDGEHRFASLKETLSSIPLSGTGSTIIPQPGRIREVGVLRAPV
jgi:hypothetical protein